MANKKSHIVVLSLLVVGCASVTEMQRIDKFEQTADAYELAIRWSDFEMASSFLKDQQDPQIATLIENLKQFKVTAYTVKRYIPSADKSQVLIIADVQFFKINGLIVKNISHRQLWEFDKDKQSWFLTSSLPDFK
jgi:hypothetical protein